ncbi:hypothetical protein ACFWP3_37975 [Streptomyces sp. NPDC058525]|uniref:hypothetical protein n=1 Tax=Streptomyces sp. NPDC058525 TaxID=3346538 RepID=UPI00365F130A
MRAYGIPGDRGKCGDPRWPAFARRYGFEIERPVQGEGEVETLEPDELQHLVLAAIAPYIARNVLAQQIAREVQQRRALEGFAGRWGAPNEGPSRHPSPVPRPAHRRTPPRDVRTTTRDWPQNSRTDPPRSGRRALRVHRPIAA